MGNRNEACPTTLTVKSGHRSKLKVVLALERGVSYVKLFNFCGIYMMGSAQSEIDCLINAPALFYLSS